MRDDMKIEMEAGRNIQLDHIKEMLAKNDMLRQNEEMVKMITKLREQNTRLQAQLNKEIHINRKMKSCLSAFARRDNWKTIEGCADWLFLLDPLMAEETLKEIDNKE